MDNNFGVGILEKLACAEYVRLTQCNAGLRRSEQVSGSKRVLPLHVTTVLLVSV